MHPPPSRQQLPTTTTLPPTTTTLPPTTTTLPPTTTTTEPAALSPLNGVPVKNDKWLDRRVMAVKIDNHPNARPQSGLLNSDLVIEEEAEGGITRFIALFLQSDSANLGPMRSVRPTDIGFLSPLGATIGYSGGQPWIKDAVNAAGIPAIGETRENEATWRITSRYAPHNLYVNTGKMRQLADEREFPNDPPETGLLTFGTPPRGVGEPASSVHIDWAFGNYVDWEWDEDEGLWLRSQQGSPHNWIDDEGEETEVGERRGKPGRRGGPRKVWTRKARSGWRPSSSSRRPTTPHIRPGAGPPCRPPRPSAQEEPWCSTMAR